MKNMMQQFPKNQIYWLIMAGICLLFTFIFYLMTDTKELTKAEKPIESDATEEIQPEKVAATKTLGALTKEVKPLELSQRVVAVNSDHGPEFRGNLFIKQNSSKWVVELFRATEESVIRSYLQHHKDVKDLVYLRLSGEGQDETYVMLYGLADNKDGAVSLSQQLAHLGLPASVAPQVVQVKSYEKWVNEVGSDELGKSGNTRVHKVVLRPVSIPVEVRQPATTSTNTTDAK
ncbi:MAG: hypothetical protein Q4D05_01360 [Acinetobacter sp.]|nr:hypothetical protein [Acinetobacter sp.]